MHFLIFEQIYIKPVIGPRENEKAINLFVLDFNRTLKYCGWYFLKKSISKLQCAQIFERYV